MMPENTSATRNIRNEKRNSQNRIRAPKSTLNIEQLSPPAIMEPD